MPKPVWRADFDRFPLVLVHVTGSDGATPPDMQSMLDTIELITARTSRKAIVIDMTYARPDAARRKQFVEWMKARWASTRNNLVAVAAVAPGALQRTAITAILWFLKPPCPMEVFERREDALAWAAAQLEREGLRVPASRR